MASAPQHRGDSTRITWLLGGNGPKQSCTFRGPYDGRLQLALTAKSLVEARGGNITRLEVYRAMGVKTTDDEPVEPTFAMWAERWISDLRKRGRPSKPTIDRYERVLADYVIPFFGGYRLTDIKQGTVEDWVAWLKRRRGMKSNRKLSSAVLAENSVRWYFVVGAQCLGAAVGKWIEVNPAATPPGQGRNTLGVPSWRKHDAVFLNAEEAALILGRCHPDLYDIAFVALRTGMRRGELMALRVRDVVFNRTGGATILVRLGRKGDGSDGEPKTESSKRDITVKGEAAEILRRRVTGRRPLEPVFTFLPKRAVRGPRLARRWNHATLGLHWSQATAAAQRCPEHPPPAPKKPRRGPIRQLRPNEVSTCTCPGVLRQRPRFHDCRHSHASALITQGWHPKKIQKRLGHATFKITMDIYGHLMDLGDDAELDSMEEFFQLPNVEDAA